MDEVLTYISHDSPDGAVRVLTRALDTAASLSTFAERGRVVRLAVAELLPPVYRGVYENDEHFLDARKVLHDSRLTA